MFCVLRILALTTWAPQNALTLSETTLLFRPKGLVHGEQQDSIFPELYNFFFEVIFKNSRELKEKT